MPGLCVLLLLNACAELPPPRDIYRDEMTVVQVRAIRHPGAAYHHPANVRADAIAAVLSGVRVQKHQDPIVSIVTGRPELLQAFSPIEVQALTGRLVEGLAAASPSELVTFYRRYSDANVGLAVTSGGLFVRGRLLYLILSNHRNLPADAMWHKQAMVTGIDPIDDPLLSLRPMLYSVSFTRPQAVADEVRRGPIEYPDPAKVLVLDLDRVLPDRPSAAPPQ